MEIGFNADYNQLSKGAVVIGDHSYWVRSQSVTPGFFTYHFFTKLDTLGNVLFDNLIPLNVELAEVKGVESSIDNSVYLYGQAWPVCDVASGCFWFVYKYDLNGAVIWSKTWDNESCSDVSMSGLSTTNSGEFYVNIVNNAVSKIYTLSASGIETDSLTITAFNLQRISSTSAFTHVASKNNVLYGIDNSGGITDSIHYTTSVQGLEVVNDSVFILTQDSIFVYNASLQVISAGNVVGTNLYSDLMVSNGDIQFVSNQGNSIRLHALTHDLVEIQNTIFPVEVDDGDHITYGDKHLVTTINHTLTEYRAVRVVDYSRLSNQDELVNWTDIGIVDIFPVQTTVESFGQPGVYTYEIWADVLVKNFGNNTLNGCRINHIISPFGICQPYVFTEYYNNLTLQPGDSVWIPLGSFHTGVSGFMSDTLSVDICLYTSHPNALTDLVMANDSYCESIVLGYVGLDELEQNKKELVRVIDLMGRETGDQPNTLLIYVYSDGTTEKVYKLE
jgi:hypothetical protein